MLVRALYVGPYTVLDLPLCQTSLFAGLSVIYLHVGRGVLLAVLAIPYAMYIIRINKYACYTFNTSHMWEQAVFSELAVQPNWLHRYVIRLHKCVIELINGVVVQNQLHKCVAHSVC